MQETAVKDAQHHLQGQRSREIGKQFEERLDKSFEYMRHTGAAIIEKTPEPMKPLSRPNKYGQFKACFTKQAQPDYKGVQKGGRMLVYEAKFTSKDRIEQERVTETQAEYMDEYAKMDARCFVVVGFMSGAVYRVPWHVWSNMKGCYGRKYATETDLKSYRVGESWNGTLYLLP